MGFESTWQFPRGKTYFGGDTSRISSSVDANLLGRQYSVLDTQHNTRREVRLMAVKNTSDGTLSAGQALYYADSDNARQRLVGGASTSVAGACCGFVDDAYGSDTIANDDIFYMVIEGPVDVTTGDIGSTFTRGDFVVTDDDADGGKVGKAATDAAFLANPGGICDEAASGTDKTMRIIACPRY